MVEHTGRVVVLDFGLARIQDAPRLDPVPASTSTPSDSATHSAVGTLGYMAPELMEGEGASEATDQFAFCVSLYEALTGGRPFVGRHAVELLEVIKAGPPSAIPSAGTPRWLHGPVLRGLAQLPSERHPSMAALKGVLERPSSHRGGATWFVGAGVVATLGGVAWSILAPAQEACTTASDDRLRARWNETRRGDARDAMLASGRPHAKETADRTLARIDRFSQAWAEAAESSCRRETSSPSAQANAVNACLERGLDRLDVALTTLERAPDSPSIADQAVDLVLSLPPVHRCEEEVPLPFNATPDQDRVVSKAIATSVAARGQRHDLIDHADGCRATADLLDRGAHLFHGLEAILTVLLKGLEDDRLDLLGNLD